MKFLKSTNTFLIVIVSVFLYWGLNHISAITNIILTFIGFCMPFIIGAATAFLINIPMLRVEKGFKKLFPKMKSTSLRGISLLATLLLIGIIISTVVLIVVPEIGLTVFSIKDEIPGFIDKVTALAIYLNTNVPDFAGLLETIGITFDSVVKMATNVVTSLSTILLSSSFNFITTMFASLFNIIFSFIFAIYILCGKEKFGKQIYLVLKAYTNEKFIRRFRKITALSNEMFSNFFAGQCLEACILGIMCFIGMTILSFPYALLISVLVGFTALVPIFGAFIGCIVGAILILIASPIKALWFILFFLVLQQIEGNVIYPKVVGSSIGLPAILVLFAVSLGGSMAGVVGILLFIPLTSVIYTLVKEDVLKRIKTVEEEE